MPRFGLLARTILAALLVFALAALAVSRITMPALEKRAREALVRSGDGTVKDAVVVMESRAERLPERFRSQLGDLPYELTAGDPAATRALVDDCAGGFEAQSRRNTAVLGQELRDRMGDRSRGRAADLAADFRSDAFLGVLLLLGAVLLLFGAGLGVSVLLPINRLLRATGRVARGDLTRETGVRGRDEVGRLGAAFDEMTRALRASREEIESLNRGLEEKVAEQTRELRETNETLRGMIRELEETRDALVHSETMATIGTLAGGVAHEFNNLLGGILGCAEDARTEDDPEAVRESLDMIRRTARRACNVTENLLRFSRPPEREMRETDLAALVSEALDLIGPETRSREVRVTAHLGEIPPVRLDAGQIHQVVLNLLTNALRAMPEGGDLTVTVDRDGEEAVVTVADTGVGIPEELRNRIFEPFFTTREATGEDRGTGLGLSVSYSIVRAHGGRIDLESHPGEGARFQVHLPAAGDTEV